MRQIIMYLGHLYKYKLGFLWFILNFVFFSFLFLLILPQNISAATYTVTKTADTDDGTCDADCSLREALDAANTNSGSDTIEFDIPVSDSGYIAKSASTHSYWSIELASSLELSDDSGVFINGYSQTGASRNTTNIGETINAVIKIELFFNFNSLALNITGDNNHITGLSIRTLRYGTSSININDSDNNWIEGNFFGSDITATEPKNGARFDILYDSDDNVFGTNGDGAGDVGERNIFMGNLASFGYIRTFGGESENSVIAGNYFGTDKTGDTCSDADIERVLISLEGNNNAYHRVGSNRDNVSDSQEANIMGCVNGGQTGAYRGFIRLISSNNTVQDNYIGVSPSGEDLGSLAGTNRGAVALAWGDVRNNMIRGNTIANGAYGIYCKSSNDQYCEYNTFRENKIYKNELLPINLAGGIEDSNGVTENDSTDSDTGQNDLINYPVIEFAEYMGGNSFWITGRLDAPLNEGPFTIEVCRASDHSSAHGGCLVSLGTTTIQEPGGWEMTVTVEGASENNLMSFTALATNKNGSTSEFSKNLGGRLPVVGPSVPVGPSYVASAPKPTVFSSVKKVTSIVQSGVFRFDAYLQVKELPFENIFNIPNTNYWQHGPKYEIWWRSSFNDAKILEEEIAKPYTLILRYPPLFEHKGAKVRIAYSNDGKSWQILPNSLHIHQRGEVAVVTKRGGWYMAVLGY